MPNDGIPLIVTLDERGSLRINSQPAGTVADKGKLVARLQETFEEREKHGVFADGTTQIEKSVALVVPPTAKHVDAVRLAFSLKYAGAKPIILAIDGHIMPPTLIELPMHRDESYDP